MAEIKYRYITVLFLFVLSTCIINAASISEPTIPYDFKISTFSLDKVDLNGNNLIMDFNIEFSGCSDNPDVYVAGLFIPDYLTISKNDPINNIELLKYIVSDILYTKSKITIDDINKKIAEYGLDKLLVVNHFNMAEDKYNYCKSQGHFLYSIDSVLAENQSGKFYLFGVNFLNEASGKLIMKDSANLIDGFYLKHNSANNAYQNVFLNLKSKYGLLENEAYTPKITTTIDYSILYKNITGTTGATDQEKDAYFIIQNYNESLSTSLNSRHAVLIYIPENTRDKTFITENKQSDLLELVIPKDKLTLIKSEQELLTKEEIKEPTYEKINISPIKTNGTDFFCIQSNICYFRGKADFSKIDFKIKLSNIKSDITNSYINTYSNILSKTYLDTIKSNMYLARTPQETSEIKLGSLTSISLSSSSNELKLSGIISDYYYLAIAQNSPTQVTMYDTLFIIPLNDLNYENVLLYYINQKICSFYYNGINCHKDYLPVLDINPIEVPIESKLTSELLSKVRTELFPISKLSSKSEVIQILPTPEFLKAIDVLFKNRSLEYIRSDPIQEELDHQADVNKLTADILVKDIAKLNLDLNKSIEQLINEPINIDMNSSAKDSLVNDLINYTPSKENNSSTDPFIVIESIDMGTIAQDISELDEENKAEIIKSMDEFEKELNSKPVPDDVSIEQAQLTCDQYISLLRTRLHIFDLRYIYNNKTYLDILTTKQIAIPDDKAYSKFNNIVLSTARAYNMSPEETSQFWAIMAQESTFGQDTAYTTNIGIAQINYNTWFKNFGADTSLYKYLDTYLRNLTYVNTPDTEPLTKLIGAQYNTSVSFSKFARETIIKYRDMNTETRALDNLIAMAQVKPYPSQREIIDYISVIYGAAIYSYYKDMAINKGLDFPNSSSSAYDDTYSYDLMFAVSYKYNVTPGKAFNYKNIYTIGANTNEKSILSAGGVNSVTMKLAYYELFKKQMCDNNTSSIFIKSYNSNYLNPKKLAPVNPVTTKPTGDYNPEISSKILAELENLKGTRYNSGGRNGLFKLNKGIDCIGLLYVVLYDIGYIPKDRANKTIMTKIFSHGGVITEYVGDNKFIIRNPKDYSKLRPGDFIFFNDYYHAAIYIGVNPNTGKHEFIHASSYYDKVVVQTLDDYSLAPNKSGRMIVARLMDMESNDEEVYYNISKYISEIKLEGQPNLVAWQPVLKNIYPYDYQ